MHLITDQQEVQTVAIPPSSPQKQGKIQKIQISRHSNDLEAFSERAHDTEEILKQAKNKYYLKREHLT